LPAGAGAGEARREPARVRAGGRFSAVHTINRGLQEAPVLRQGLGLTWCLAAVGATSRVVVPILLQQAIDKGIITDEGVKMNVVATLTAIAAVALVIAGFAQRHAVVRLGQRGEQALYDLRARLIAHIHRLSLADHNEERRGALVARVTSDIETLTEFFQWGGLAWLLDGPLMLLVAAVMLAYNWILALVAFAVAAPLAIVLRLVQRHLVTAYERARERNGEMLAAVTEVVTGAETIRAYDAGATLGADVEQAITMRADAQIRANRIGAFLFPSGEVFSVLTVAAVIVVGVVLGPASGLTAGAMIGFVFLTYRFLEPIAEFTEVLDQTQTAVAGLRRVLGVLDLPVGPPPPLEPRPLPPGPLDIDIRDVTFAYPTRGLEETVDEAVLRHVTAHLPAGQQVALVGATGSGKTTLGRLIARLADPTFGEICLGGVPLRYVSNEDLRSRLVVVSQEPFLFNTSIAANIGFARPGTSIDDMEEVVRRLELDEWVAAMPDGLLSGVGERGDELSAGERQLVALLRAGVADPDVLVLDEATSSVDALTEVRISRALTHLAEGRTTIAIAHRLSTAARADRVLVLDRGALVEDGSHEELVAAGGVYARLFDAWMAATTAERAAFD
jgi:putative ABC transport system ATP-binding protein